MKEHIKQFKSNTGESFLLKIEYPNLKRAWKENEEIKIFLMDKYQKIIPECCLKANITEDRLYLNYIIISNEYQRCGFGSILFWTLLNLMLHIERKRRFYFKQIMGTLYDTDKYDSNKASYFYKSFDNFVYDERTERCLKLDKILLNSNTIFFDIK